MPISAVVTTLQDGDQGSAGSGPSVYVLGVSDDRLAMSSLKWQRTTLRVMPGMPAPTSGTFTVGVSANGQSATSAAIAYDATPWEIAQAITAAYASISFEVAVVPITITGTVGSSVLSFELRYSANDRDLYWTPGGSLYVISSISQTRSNSVPSQSESIAINSYCGDSVYSGSITVESSGLNLATSSDESSTIANRITEIIGPVATVARYANSGSHQWYAITCPSNVSIGVTHDSSSHIYLWQVHDGNGSVGTCEIQSVEITGDPNTGTLTLSLAMPSGTITTDPIAWNATADDVRDALHAVASEPFLRGRFPLVQGGLPLAIRVIFSTLDGDLPELTVDTSGLSQAVSPEVDLGDITATASIDDLTAIVSPVVSLSDITATASIDTMTVDLLATLDDITATASIDTMTAIVPPVVTLPTITATALIDAMTVDLTVVVTLEDITATASIDTMTAIVAPLVTLPTITATASIDTMTAIVPPVVTLGDITATATMTALRPIRGWHQVNVTAWKVTVASSSATPR